MEANIQESWELAKMIQERNMELYVPKTAKNPFPEASSSSSSSSSMVGLSDQFLQIRDDLLTDEFEYGENITWISGMAGIGKTRLAKKLFHDPSVKANFECRAFIMMDGDCTAFDNENKIMEGDFKTVWKLLIRDRKSLIVFDDVRENAISYNHLLDTVSDSKGSRIMVTSRMYFGDSTIYMRFLNEEESWELLRREVFGDEDCPKELVKAGKKIAEECEGLPLLIIVVAPILLSKAQKNPESWKRVAEKPDSVLEEASFQISEVLLSNYHQLTSEELKLCFLYITAFPKKYVVWATTIAYLWYAEGFNDSWDFFANYHMDSLLKNNLVLGRQKGYWSKVVFKACSLHCAYWYVCRREADTKRILYTINNLDDGLDERIKGHRRLAIYTNVLLAIKEVHDTMASISTIRSLLCTGPYNPYQVPMCWNWKLLRVLSALTIRFYEFPVEVVQLICLKYLCLTCNVNLPPSISQLWNLQFLIVHQHSIIKRVGVVSYLPVEIWNLQELEVLHIMGRNLPDPPRSGVVLPKLRKLLDVGVESCTKGVLESLPCLKKLRVQIELAPLVSQTMSCFDHLSCLHELHSFQCVVRNPSFSHPSPALLLSSFLYNLTNLSLRGFGYPWEVINNITPLPSLAALKLESYAFRGEKWEGEGMCFSRLSYLCIEDTDLMRWTAGYGTFPCLSQLMMRNCHKLQEIPQFSTMFDDYNPRFGIELVDCNPVVESFINQRFITLKHVTVTATYSWKEEK